MILKELGKYNKIARKYLKKGSLNYKHAYERLQKTETWNKSKALLIEYFSLSNDAFICPVCKTKLNPYASTMHHNIYDNKKLFDPKYISFLHYNCHQDYHQKREILATGTKRYIKAYFGSRGLRIYIPKIGKLYLRFELCALLIVIIIILFYSW